MSNGCLIDELKKLKESSKEAVENISDFSSFKKYMHVKRQVENELLDIIKYTADSNKAELILVCGGVGDGKSHLISYLNNKYPEIMSKFIIHNDATESFEPNKTSIDTLNDVLDDFSDKKMDNSDKKLVLAINLGALSNFLESEYVNKFTKLREFVENKGILDISISDDDDKNSNFHFVNFSDYHIYTLNADKPKSRYIESIINKIIAEDNQNIFINSYKTNCTHCIVNYKCPIKNNYEMLMRDSVRETLVDILIESTVKYKIIISTRSLLNFIYDFIVNVDLDNKNNKDLIKFVEELSYEAFIKYIFVSNLYNHSELSQILNAVNKIDPINITSENLDNIIIKLSNTKDMTILFNQYLNLSKNSYLESSMTNREIIESALNSSKNELSRKILKYNIINTFIRLHIFIPKNNLQLRDNIYISYMRNLYYFNKGEKTYLSNLYDDIKEALYSWNGRIQDDRINMSIGKNQMRYKISQRLNIIPDLSKLRKCTEEELHKFKPSLEIGYKNDEKENQDTCTVDIDFNLYKLLMRVKYGYTPNNNDKYTYINFVVFMNKIHKLG
ncbi:DNA phosphorothioation-dependent restriction protein DptF, partial [Clostridioides difficile]|nr:DNA phosphorothioation-dependent restriction protein DptF [Clostridioides difficile]